MKRTLIAVVLLAFVAVACGGGKDSPAIESSANIVEITMVDIAYEPKGITVKPGEPVELVFKNQGKIAHDAFVGDSAAQAEHEQEMRQRDGSGGGDQMAGHDKGGAKDPNAITVQPGKTGRLTHTFEAPGTIEIGCHQPGHYAAGMKIAVTVA